MKIRGWFIEGFGIFRDYEIRDLSDRLVVFYGPNEAGKSTLLAFVRGVLFGFPDRRSRDPQYPPIRGGRHGGRVFLIGPDGGEYTIEREAGRRAAPEITFPDGTPGTEDDLRRILGGADDILFRSVFAFSLEELHSFRSLDAAGIRDRIFSAGIAGAGRSAREVIATLQEQATSLLRPRGSARVNDLAEALSRLRSSINAAKLAANRYTEHLQDETQCRAELERLDKMLVELRKEKSRYETLIELWPAQSELTSARMELGPLETIETFPPDPEDRLADILSAVRSADSTLADLIAEADATAKRKDALPRDDKAETVSREVDYLNSVLALHRERSQELSRARGELERAARAVADKLTELGPGWDEERLRRFDRSIPKREEVRSWEERLQVSAGHVEVAQRDVMSAQEKRIELQRVKDTIKAGVMGVEPLASSVLDDQERVLRRLRATLADLRAEQAELRSQEAIVQDRQRAIHTLESEVLWLPPRLLEVFAWSFTGLSLLAAIWRAFVKDIPTLILLLLLALGAASVASIIRHFRAHALTHQARRQLNLTALREELEHATRRLSSQRETIHHLQSILGTDPPSIGLPIPVSSQAIEDRERDLLRDRERRGEWDRTLATLQRTDQDLDRAAAASESQEAGVRTAREAQRRLVDQWADWKNGLGVPSLLTPRGVLDFFETIRSACVLLETRVNTEDQVNHLQSDVVAWDMRAHQALKGAQQLRRTDASGEELVEEFLQLHDRCSEEKERRNLRTSLDDQLEELLRKVATARQQLQEYHEARDRLFSEAEVEDELQFRARLAIYRERVVLKKTIQDRDEQIRARIGHGTEADLILAELSAGHLEDWRGKSIEMNDKLNAAEQAKTEAIRRDRDIEAVCQTLSESADVPALEAEREGLTTELIDALDKWRTLALAEGLITETLREFERTRQPEVLSEASKAFSIVTGSRYDRLVQPEGAEELTVLDHQGGRKRIEELSRGTAEQLYLCIRLGLVSEFAQRSTPLPMVMDDVLVNFDPDRAAAMAKLLANFAAGQQVLLFTCHPETRDLLVEVDRGVHIVDIIGG